jgi:hypothetical protein
MITKKNKLVFFVLFILAIRTPICGQRDLAIDNKGTITEVYRTTVTTATVQPSDPYLKDIWFDTTTYITKVWNGVGWDEINELPDIGDIKYGMQPTDHNGWIRLDGRLLNILTLTQQTEALSLGLLTNLPDALDRNLMLRNTGNIGDVGGTNSFQIQQQHLPNVTFTGTTSTNGGHGHTIQDRRSTGTIKRGTSNPTGAYRDRVSTARQSSFDGDHNHTGGMVSTGGLDTPINYTPSFLNVNVFVYLGN